MYKYLFISIALFFCFTANAQNQKVTNTDSFITYFTTYKSVKDYISVKDSVEKLGLKIKSDNSISALDKARLHVSYDSVQAKSSRLYDKLVTDLLSKSKRADIRKDPNAYAQSLNNNFKEIKSASDLFNAKYAEISGQKGFILLWLLQEIIIPLAKEFINEKINEAVKNKLNQHLKPQLVIKPWDNL